MRRHAARPTLPGHGRMENYCNPLLVIALCLLFRALWAAWGTGPNLTAARALVRLVRRAARQ